MKTQGEKLTLDDIKSYNIENYVSPQYREDFSKIFLDERMWKRVELLSNCVETIKQLHNAGYDLWFVTSTEAINAPKKFSFLTGTFPFINVRKRFITTPCKQMIDVDILINDAVHNVVNAPYYSILFDYPWNRDIDMDKNQNVFRVEGWQDVFETVKFLEKWQRYEREK